MNKPFTTFVEESATLCDKIYFSAGKVGYQVQLAPDDLIRLIGAKYQDLV